jgi:propanol-preferring alcohol dehydrogenase
LAQGRTVFAFTWPGDVDAQRFARRLGVDWAGGSDEPPPSALEAALIFAPAGPLCLLRWRQLRRADRLCARASI